MDSKAQAAYELGYAAEAGSKNPFSFNSGRRSYVAWAKGYKARRDEQLPALLAWLEAQ